MQQETIERIDFEGGTHIGSRMIFLDPNRIDGYTNEPARRHKRKRIQKKWLKRYGYKPKVDENIYYLANGIIVMHPATFRKFAEAIGSDEAAEEAIIKYYGGKKP